MAPRGNRTPRTHSVFLALAKQSNANFETASALCVRKVLQIVGAELTAIFAFHKKTAESYACIFVRLVVCTTVLTYMRFMLATLCIRMRYVYIESADTERLISHYMKCLAIAKSSDRRHSTPHTVLLVVNISTFGLLSHVHTDVVHTHTRASPTEKQIMLTLLCWTHKEVYAKISLLHHVLRFANLAVPKRLCCSDGAQSGYKLHAPEACRPYRRHFPHTHIHC